MLRLNYPSKTSCICRLVWEYPEELIYLNYVQYCSVKVGIWKINHLKKFSLGFQCFWKQIYSTCGDNVIHLHTYIRRVSSYPPENLRNS